MSLKERIKSDLKEAMRAKDVFRRNTLRNLTAAIKQIEVDERRELSDADVEAILMKYAKQREDAKAQFKAGGRDDLIENEDKELAIVAEYLPEPMSDEELEQIISEIIQKTEASSMKDMGRVMGVAKKEIGSRSDGGRISKMVKKLLQ